MKRLILAVRDNWPPILLGAFFVLCAVVGLLNPPNWESVGTRKTREGYEAALNGLPPECCPYDASGGCNEGGRDHWMKGWQRGYLERKGK